MLATVRDGDTEAVMAVQGRRRGKVRNNKPHCPLTSRTCRSTWPSLGTSAIGAPYPWKEGRASDQGPQSCHQNTHVDCLSIYVFVGWELADAQEPLNVQRARMQDGAPLAPLSGGRDGGFGWAMTHSPAPEPAPQQHEQVVRHRLAQERPNGRSSAPVTQESEPSFLKTLSGQKPRR